MPAYRLPILVFRDVAGQYTAALVEDDGDIAAYGETAAQAREQLRDHLERVYRGAGAGARAPELTEAQLTTVRVDVRPEYATGNRVYPCAETIALRMPVATGQPDEGVWVAAMPTLGVRFNYFDPADLKSLVVQYVQQRLRGKSPADVARFLPPAEVELQDVVVQVPRELRRRAEAPDLSALEAVADPIASRELRGRYGRAWEREEWVETLTQALTRETAPILLLGESGVGKTTILAEAARRLERAGAPMSVGEAAAAASTGLSPRTHRFWLTSAPRLIAGMQYLGMWQDRVEEAIAQAATIAGVLCVENLLDLVRTGGRSAGDSIGAFLVPYLQRGEVRLVSEATAAELDALRRLLPGLADLFRVVTLPPFSRDRAVACLNHVAAAHRQDAKVEFTPGTAETVYRLFARFAPYRPFPGGAVPFVHELFDRATRDRASVVGPAQATTLFSARTGVPELFLRDEMPLGHDEVVRALDREVIGQPRACRAAAGVVTTFKAGLNDPHRPLGVLLFAGPTGVGKTQLAQSLAGYLYGAGAAGERRRLVRLDMSEYAGPDAAERFLGSPDGGPAEWIQNVRRQPFTVLLFDEIEKAAAEVFDLLLGLFDEGRLTDPWGRLTHFTSAVVVMTTNLGRAGTPGGGTFGLARNAPPPPYDAEVRAFFRPEFFNRIDAVVPFDPLGPETIRMIAEKELSEIASRDGLRKFGVRLTWTPAVVEMLAREGFDVLYGARPLQRAIESRVVTALARYLVEQPVARGATLMLDVGADGHVTVRRD